MATGERRRARLAATAYVAYVLVVPVLAALHEWIGGTPTLSVLAVAAAVQLTALPLEVAQLVVAVIGGKRIPFSDRMPGEVYASIVAVPIGSTAGATAGSLALDVEWSGVGWIFFAALALLALTMSVGVPLLMAYRVTMERSGRELALWDDSASAAGRLYTAQRWWSNHAATRRWVLAEQRSAWLGAIDEEPATAWPTAWRGRRVLRFGWLAGWLPLASAVVLTPAAAPLVGARDGEWISVAVVAIAVAVATETLVVRVARLTIEEQTVAGRIRERYHALRAELAERAAPEEPAPPSSRWRRAWRAALREWKARR